MKFHEFFSDERVEIRITATNKSIAQVRKEAIESTKKQETRRNKREEAL